MRRRFNALLAGLSAASVFRAVAGDELTVIEDPGSVASALAGL